MSLKPAVRKRGLGLGGGQVVSLSSSNELVGMTSGLWYRVPADSRHVFCRVFSEIVDYRYSCTDSTSRNFFGCVSSNNRTVSWYTIFVK